MRKILLFLCLFAVSSYALTARTWSSSASTDMNDTLNYTGGTGALGAGDSLIFNSGAIAATASANLSVGAIVTTAGYSGAWSISGSTLTLAQGAAWDGTGTLNLGNAITANGNSATVHIGTGVGTVTATSCALTMNGTTAMVLDIDKAATFTNIVLGASAIVTSSGATSLNATGNVPFTLNNSCTWNNNAAFNLNQNATGNLWSIGVVPTITGTAAGNYFQNTCTAANTTVGVPAFTKTGAAPLIMQSNASSGTTTFNLSGAINTGVGNLTLMGYGNSVLNVNTNGNSITCAGYDAGSQGGTQLKTINYGASVMDITKYSGNLSNAINGVHNFQTSNWTCSGVWTHGTNHTINVGTSSVTIDSTSTITTANKSPSFFDLVVNAATKTVILADSLILATGGDLTVTAGTLLGKSKNYHVTDLVVSNGSTFNDSLASVYIAGNATFGSTSTRPTSTGKYIFSAGAAHAFATGGRRFDSVSVLGSTSISVSDTMGLFMAPAVRVTNANTITLLAYDIEGSTGSLDSLTGGTINIPANDTLDFIYLQGVTLTAGDTLWVKTSASGGEGIDGGGNSGNIIFLDAASTTGTPGILHDALIWSSRNRQAVRRAYR